MEQLTQAQHKAAASLYQQTAGSATGGGPGGSGGHTASTGSAGSSSTGGAKGDVIDAEVVDEGKP
jgi:hypothetical protein